MAFILLWTFRAQQKNEQIVRPFRARGPKRLAHWLFDQTEQSSNLAPVTKPTLMDLH
jgi:hypothetical protein